MATNGNSNSSWFQWVLGTLVVIAMAVTGYAMNKTDSLADVVNNQTIKKDQYYRDIDEIKNNYKAILSELQRIRWCEK